MSRASLDKIPGEVSTMFDGVAGHYDLVNSLMTVGMDARWRKHMVKALGVKRGDRVLDIAAGTAVSTHAVQQLSGAWVVGTDFSLGMLQQGRGRHVPLVKNDAMNLSFHDASFDGACIAFGLRNVHDPVVAMKEAYRVLKPGGKYVVLETSSPSQGLMGFIIRSIAYPFARWIGAIAGSNAQAYRYLIESIIAWPDADALSEYFRSSGFSQVSVKKFLGGAVAIHRGIKE